MMQKIQRNTLNRNGNGEKEEAEMNPYDDIKLSELDTELLEKVTGGTKDETNKLFAYLLFEGYGLDCLDDDYRVDVNKIKGLFKKWGYNFKPSEDGQNFFEKDGLLYGQDYIIDLIKKEQLF